MACHWPCEHSRVSKPSVSRRAFCAPDGFAGLWTLTLLFLSSSYHPTVNYESGILSSCAFVKQEYSENSMRDPTGAVPNQVIFLLNTPYSNSVYYNLLNP